MYGRNSRGGGARASSTRAPLKGLFSDGTWKCNCDPRLPAQHLQTKNGGRNHGRWFYTCQQPQPKRCGFFLWADEAKIREEAAVLNNSRTEPMPATPQTPRRATTYGLPTPQTSRQVWSAQRPDQGKYPTTPSKAPKLPTHAISTPNGNQDETQTTTVAGSSDEEYYDWPNSDEERVVAQVRTLERAANKTPKPSSPSARKSAKLNIDDSPSRSTSNATGGIGGAINIIDEGVLDDPFQSTKIEPDKTPAKASPADGPLSQSVSTLSNEILDALKEEFSAPLYHKAQERIKLVCEKHEVRLKAVTKARDVMRGILQQKDQKIAQMQVQCEALRDDRTTDRALNQRLKRQVADLQAQKKA